MICKRKLMVLILFSFIAISSLSAISAADSNGTDVQAVDNEEIELEQADFNDSNLEIADDEEKEIGMDSNQEVLGDGYRFSDLNELIRDSESLEVTLPHGYKYDGNNDPSDEYVLRIDRDNLVLDGDYNTIYGLTGSNIIGFRVSAMNVVIKNIHFEKMRTVYNGYDGAAIGADSRDLNLTVINCTFYDCYTYNGGAVANCAHVIDCNFTKCRAFNLGAGAYNSFVERCNFISNSASSGGGATYQCSAVDCTFKYNEASGNNSWGGAMSYGIAINCTFIGNTAKAKGGALYVGNAEDCTFIGNEAGEGGAFHGYNVWYDVVNCTFEDNHATIDYGASSLANLVMCTFKDNTADHNHLPYEIGAVKIPDIISEADSYEVYKPDSAVIPISYCFVGTFGQEYYFDNISLVVELYKENQLLGEFNCLSGSNWTQELDKGSYSLRDKEKNSQICTILVHGLKTIIKAEASIEMYVDEDMDLVVNLTDKSYDPLVGQFIYLKQGSTILNASRTNGTGQVIFSLKNIPAGIYDNVHVEFVEDNIYAGADSSLHLVVKRYDAILKADNVTKFADEDTCLLVNLTGTDNMPIGNCMVYLKEDGNTLEALPTDAMGQVRFTLENVAAGVHNNVHVEFQTNDRYEGANIVVGVVINKYGTILKADNVTAFPYEGKIVAELTDESGNLLYGPNVYLDLAFFHSLLGTPRDDGKVEFDIEGLAEGDFTGTITFNENRTHKGSSVDVGVKLHRLDSRIDASNFTFVYADSGILTAYLKDSNNNPIGNANVDLVIDKIYESLRTNADGRVGFDLSTKLSPGTYTGRLFFDYTNRYASSTLFVNVTVEKITTVVTSYDMTCTYGEGKYLTATLKDKKGNPIANQSVSLKSNVKTLTGKTDDKGQVKFLIDFPPRDYTVSVSFSGNDILQSSVSNVKVVVNRVNEKIPTAIVAYNLSSVYNEGKYLIITLKDDYGDVMDGKQLVITFNGKTKSHITDKNGQVRLSTSSLVPKTYRAKVTFSGDNKYEGSSFSVNLVVKKANPYLFASKKKFKVKSSKKYKVTLKNNRNAAMKNVRIYLKVNGKSYNVKTNKKGQAIFDLKKLTKKGTYKAIVTYKGNSCYNKVTKTAKITIK